MNRIKTSEVATLLKTGYVRWKKDETTPGKSIQSHYNLRFSECKDLFKKESIKRKRTIVSRIEVEDDLAAPATSNVVAMVEVPIVNPIENLFG